jgi:hypothetical protein
MATLQVKAFALPGDKIEAGDMIVSIERNKIYTISTMEREATTFFAQSMFITDIQTGIVGIVTATECGKCRLSDIEMAVGKINDLMIFKSKDMNIDFLFTDGCNICGEEKC